MKYRTALFLVAAALVLFALNADAPAQESSASPQGFENYLPEDIISFVSMRNTGKIISEIEKTEWYAKYMELGGFDIFLYDPAEKREFDEFRKMLETDPEYKQFLESGRELLMGEATVAVPRESVHRMFNAFEMLVDVAFVYEGNMAAGSPEAAKYLDRSRTRARLFLDALKTFKVPSFVAAFKVTDEKSAGYFLTQLGQKIMEQKALARGFSEYKSGERTFNKLVIRLKELVGAEELARITDGVAALDDPELSKNVLAALGDLALEAHYGRVGQYLVFTAGPDDSLLKRILEIADGKSRKTLAAKPGFAETAEKITADTCLVSYKDYDAAKRAFNDRFVPALKSMSTHFMAENFKQSFDTDPADMLDQLIANIRMAAFRYHKTSFVMNTGPRVTLEGYVNLDKEELAKTGFGMPGIMDPGVIEMMPYSTTACMMMNMTDYENSVEKVRAMLEQQFSMNMNMQKNAPGMDPKMAQYQKKMNDWTRRLLDLVEQKWLPVMSGNSISAMGQTGYIEKIAEMKNIPLPQFAAFNGIKEDVDPMPAASEMTDLMKEYVLLQLEIIPNLKSEMLSFESGTVIHEGKKIYCHYLTRRGNRITGDFVPNYFRLDNYLVMSTSLKYSRQIIDRASGKDEGLVKTDTFKEAAPALPDKVSSMGYADSQGVIKNLARTFTYFMDLYEENVFVDQINKRQYENYIGSRRMFENILRLMKCFRGLTYTTMTQDGKQDFKVELILKDIDK